MHQPERVHIDEENGDQNAVTMDEGYKRQGPRNSRQCSFGGTPTDL
jgi:hypothetical protein